MGRANRTSEVLRKLPARVSSVDAVDDNQVVARNYDQHPLLAGKFFYLLPVELLRKVIGELGERRFDRTLLEMELALARSCGDDSSRIGRWQGAWISYEYLNSEKNKRGVGSENTSLSQQDNSRFVRPFTINYLYANRKHHRIFQAYLGWLLTNLQFVKEQDALFNRNREVVRRWGVDPEDVSFAEIVFRGKDDPTKDSAWNEFRRERDQFYFRWRLSSMSGPDLPVPIGSQPDVDVPISYFVWGKEQTGLYLLPDILPVPDRDEIRRSIDESRQRIGAAEHLSRWLRIIRSGNKAKNRLDRFARIFKLQHYWRLLESRHHDALRTSIGKLEAVFADWMHVSEETIHQDRLNIIKCLGADWTARGSIK